MAVDLPGLLRYHLAGDFPGGNCILCCQSVTKEDSSFSLPGKTWHEECWFADRGLLSQRPTGSKAMRRGIARVLYTAYQAGGSDVASVTAQLEALPSNPTL